MCSVVRAGCIEPDLRALFAPPAFHAHHAQDAIAGRLASFSETRKQTAARTLAVREVILDLRESFDLERARARAAFERSQRASKAKSSQRAVPARCKRQQQRNRQCEPDHGNAGTVRYGSTKCGSP